MVWDLGGGIGRAAGLGVIDMGLPSGEAVADELGEVVDGADQGPFMADLVEAAQAEPPEAARRLDLAEDGPLICLRRR